MRPETLERRRKVLSLYLRGYSPADISEMLGIARQTVYNDIFRMKKERSEELNAHFAFELHELLCMRSEQRLKELWRIVLSTESDWVRVYSLRQLRLEDSFLLRVGKFFERNGEVDAELRKLVRELTDGSGDDFDELRGLLSGDGWVRGR